jgi:hypothetical protein
MYSEADQGSDEKMCKSVRVREMTRPIRDLMQSISETDRKAMNFSVVKNRFYKLDFRFHGCL